MYGLTSDTAVDLPAERAAIVRQLERTWAPIAALPLMIEAIQQHAFAAARAWFEAYAVTDRLHLALDARAKRLAEVLVTPEAREYGPWYDRLHALLQAMAMEARALRDAALALDGPWDFERTANRLHGELSVAYPDLPRARPLGWDTLEASYDEDPGFSAFDHAAAAAAFDGANTAGAGSADFVYRTALPSVMYDEREQGRSASRVLVGAVFGHFLRIREHANTQALLAAIDVLPLAEAPAALIFEAPALASDNALLQALIDVAEVTHTSAEKYETALATARAFALLPAAERAARRERAVDELIASIRADEADPVKEQRTRTEREQKLHHALAARLPAY